MANTVTSKGQVTIPKAVRDRLGIQAGSAVTSDFFIGAHAAVRGMPILSRGGGGGGSQGADDPRVSPSVAKRSVPARLRGRVAH